MRIARGLVCASVSLLLGCLAHVVAAGHPPGLVAFTGAFAVLVLVSVALAEAQRGFGFIATVLGGTQLFLHFVFSLSAAPSVTMSRTGGAVVVNGHGEHIAVPAAGVPADAGLALSSSAMTLGHVLATLVAAACLAYGERAIWRVARLAALVAPLLLWASLRPVPIQVAPRTRPEPAAFAPLIGVLLARSAPLRGPPRAATA